MKTILLSEFKRPDTPASTKSVDYLEGFWQDLLAKINPVFKYTVVFLLFIALFPGPHYKVLTEPVLPSQDFAQLPTIPESHLQPVSELAVVYVNQLRPQGTYANTYAPGQCTWYVASRLPVPGNLGNANTWAYMAGLDGLTVSNVPKAGAAAQTAGDSYLGHVAVVESVNPDGSFVISEMNYNGPYSVDTRTTSTAEFPSFIYL